MQMLDFYVLKDGLPIFSRQNDQCSGAVSEESRNQLTMVSGFLCAVSSFASNLGRYGTMQELSMSNDIKITFFKETLANSELLFVLITKMSDIYETNRRLLEKLANHFTDGFREELSKAWNGDVSRFDIFQRELTRDYDEFMHDLRMREHALYLRQRDILARQLSMHRRTEFEPQREQNLSVSNRSNTISPSLQDKIYSIIPIPRTQNRELIRNVSFSPNTIEIFDQINGKNTIKAISYNLGITSKEVYEICKILVKNGFIGFTQ